MNELPIIAIVFAILTLITLIVGVIVMAKGGKINTKLSNKLMILRVSLQGVAVLLIIIGAIFAL
jgi:hypothetical protein